MELLFAIGAGAYGATTAAYLADLFTNRNALAQAARTLLTVTLLFWAGLLAVFAVRAGAEGGVRFWLCISGWSLCALYWMLLRRYPLAALGSFVTALATMLALLALFVVQPAEVSDTVRSWLLRIHIGLAFVGITAFAFATGASLLYLAQSRSLKAKQKGLLQRRLPPLDVLDRLAYRGILVGFPFYTLALLLGSAQAVKSGETGVHLTYVLAVISWVIYGVVLQARITAGWRGRRAAILTSAGLITALVVVMQYSLGMAR
ncbi:MAG: cytochrome c biogenesis protein CcsA [bacterium]